MQLFRCWAHIERIVQNEKECKRIVDLAANWNVSNESCSEHKNGCNQYKKSQVIGDLVMLYKCVKTDQDRWEFDATNKEKQIKRKN